jgi:UDP-glucuronate 4-epimerase
MRAMVTGAAGFIGGHLCERLLDDGHEVLGVDKLTDYYDVGTKRDNRDRWATRRGASSIEDDVTSARVLDEVKAVDVVYHLAGQPGVRPSWRTFDTYVRENIATTHALLDAVQALPRPPRLVLASSSSVYGDAVAYPCREDGPTAPLSPYGVSKLCMEDLARAYVTCHDLPVVLLRYFTVYGPRQRPDMAFHRFITAALEGSAAGVFGDGEQVRQFTYVTDVVDATVRAGCMSVPPGTALNICGGEPTTVNAVLELLSELLGHPVPIESAPAEDGDVRRTGGSGVRAEELLQWRPQTPLREGLAEQLAWHRARPKGRAPMRVA